MELAKELLSIAGRIVTILPLLLVLTLIMGKRSVGELPVFDFLLIITLGAVVGADIADPSINHIHTAFAIVLIGILQLVASKWAIKSRIFGRLITFEPTIVIKDGKFLKKNMENIRYSVDNVLQMLREKDIFDVSHVQLAIVEANGKLTVQRLPNKETVSVEDMGIIKPYGDIAYTVVLEGQVYPEVLVKLNLSEAWLIQQLNRRGIMNLDRVFYASINERKELHVSLEEQSLYSQPPVQH